MLPTDSHVWWAYFLAVIETVYKSWDLHSLLVTAALWQPNMNEIYSNLPFSTKDFLHLKCRDYFIIGQNVSSFHLWKYLFSNRRALSIKLNKLTIKNLTCNDVTTVCICYVLLILHLYFLSCPYSAWTNAVWHFLHLPKIMDKKKEHCYHSYFCFL